VGASPSSCAPVDARDWVGVACSGGATRAGGSAAEEHGGGGASASPVQGEGVGKLQGDVRKPEVGSIGVEEGRKGVLHDGQEAAAGGGRRQWRSGQNLMAARG
jgi:hypothetical protein